LPQPLQKKQPAGEVGIDHNILATNLKEETRVANEGDAEFAVGYKFRYVSLARTRRNRRMPHQASKLTGAFAQRRIFQ